MCVSVCGGGEEGRDDDPVYRAIAGGFGGAESIASLLVCVKCMGGEPWALGRSDTVQSDRGLSSQIAIESSDTVQSDGSIAS
jgi:hypothetical protein